VGEVVDRTAVVGALTVALLVVSGTVYSVGALVYALKRPDPFPTVFGYHEVFHAMVVVASGCLFAHVVLVLRAV
jgi:hemolysin III